MNNSDLIKIKKKKGLEYEDKSDVEKNCFPVPLPLPVPVRRLRRGTICAAVAKQQQDPDVNI